MPRAYSNDLRRKFLQAYDEGDDSLEELAEQFRVSLGWAKKISARRTRTGEVEAPVWRHGPVSRVTAEVQEWIRRQIRAQPDSTLQELREQLEETNHVRLSMGRMWLALRQLGLPLKKSAPRTRARSGSRAAPPPSLARSHSAIRCRAVGFSRREWSHDADDPQLRSCSTRPTGERGYAARPMASLDHAGRTDYARAGSADDHWRSDGWRHFPRLPGAGLVSSASSRPGGDHG